ncbi:hypothetical protein JCGZ_19554 [Jatropha curcas]|uniref:Uncharacterized protein n=1 Tax=Jatropha curcas TaxID=180498 RepID=A0A067JUT1_JATCU|nr:hypothetical protein JCGZ_19554 [Jatropha curcas]
MDPDSVSVSRVNGRSAPPCAPTVTVTVNHRFDGDDRVASCWYGKEKREWKNNERAGQVRIRPVGQYGGSAPWCTRCERMSHVGGRLIGGSVTPLTNFHVM